MDTSTAMQFDTLKAICQSVMASVPFSQSLTMDAFPSSAEDEINSGAAFTNNDWRQEQSQDKTIGRVIEIIRSGSRQRVENIKRKPLQVQKFHRVFKKLELI